MDKAIIQRWNERVNDGDVVFHLGDFCMLKSSEAPESRKDAFNYYRSQLKGNIIFLKGNHDGNNKNKSIIESIVIEHGGHRIYMAHDPKFAKLDFRFNFCGHVHDKWQFQRIGNGKSIIINLSLEHWDYRPVDINDIMSAYSYWFKSGKK
jgi:calcineurin-like phosphoesterase family protein